MRHDTYSGLKLKLAHIAAAALAVCLVAGTIALPTIADATDQCATSCRQAHNECRIKNKGAPSCDTQLQTCLQICLSQSKAPTKK